MRRERERVGGSERKKIHKRTRGRVREGDAFFGEWWIRHNVGPRRSLAVRERRMEMCVEVCVEERARRDRYVCTGRGEGTKGFLRFITNHWHSGGWGREGGRVRLWCVP